MSAAMVWLVCPVCSHRVGVLEGSTGFCWGRGFIGHPRRRMRPANATTPGAGE